MFALGVFNTKDGTVGLCNEYIERQKYPWLNYSSEFGIMFLKDCTAQGLERSLMQKMYRMADEYLIAKILE